jgi:hypothetical protein
LSGRVRENDVISESFGEDGDDLVVCSPPFGRRRRYVS